jgi:hypothetical protein
VALAAGFWQMWLYAYTPGEAARAPEQWPSVALRHDTARPTLVMVLHPECSCSNASVEDLSRVLAKAPARAMVFVLFDTHAVDRDALKTTRLWRDVSAIPDVTPIADATGDEARRFGAFVSGQTFLYDKNGRLAFSGGVTASRGHAGDNDGTDALAALLDAREAPLARTPVFGCPLHGD